MEEDLTKQLAFERFILGVKITDIAEEFQVSRKTIYNWLEEFNWIERLNERKKQIEENMQL